MNICSVKLFQWVWSVQRSKCNKSFKLNHATLFTLEYDFSSSSEVNVGVKEFDVAELRFSELMCQRLLVDILAVLQHKHQHVTPVIWFLYRSGASAAYTWMCVQIHIKMHFLYPNFLSIFTFSTNYNNCNAEYFYSLIIFTKLVIHLL